MAGLLKELRRRKVFQATAAYVVLAIGALELVDVLVPATNLPAWTDAFLVVVAILGLPIVIALAWTYDLGPKGVERTASADAAGTEPADREGDSAVREPAGGHPDSAGGAEAERPAARGRDALDPRTVAVLPFTNRSGDAEAAPFAAGLQDDLLTELSRASALTVISRTSVAAFRESKRSMGEIGHELGAGTIVEAGVQKAGGRVRLNVQLIDARTDTHLWAERYDRELTTDTIFQLQTELASEIMDRLQTTLLGVEAAAEAVRPTADLEAYRQYSIGRAYLVERSEDALASAATHFQAAVDRDPGYALAWAGLSLALTLFVDYRHASSEDVLARGEAAARTALELDPQLAEAHAALGCWLTAKRQCGTALESHTRAAELRPGYSGAHQWRCWASLLIGDPETAAEAGARAVRLDPMDPEARGNLVLAYVGCGLPERGLDVAREATDRGREFDWVRWAEALALLHVGRRTESSEAFAGLSEPWAAHWPATMHALDAIRSGDEAAARRVLDEHRGAGRVCHAGLLHLALDETELGIDHVRSALPLLWDEALFLRYHRGWPLASLADDPRWGELLEALDDAWGAR